MDNDERIERKNRPPRSPESQSRGPYAGGGTGRTSTGTPLTNGPAGRRPGTERPANVRPDGRNAGQRPKQASAVSSAQHRQQSERRRQQTIEERRLQEYMRLKKKREKNFRIVVSVCIALLVVILLIGVLWGIIGSGNKGEKNGDSNPTPTVSSSVSGEKGGTPTPTLSPTPTPTPAPKTVSLIAVGDNLVHEGVYKAGRQSDGSHDYSCLYENIADYIKDADIKVINQETVFGGDEKGLSSYPNFNSPEGIGDAVVEAGFNVVLHASNHAFDMGLDGLLNSVEFWKTEHPETTMLGIYETAEEQSIIPVVEYNGIKIAMLNYTYSHNWESFSSSAEGHLNMLCDYDPDSRMIDFDTINPQVIEDIKEAEEFADFTIIFPHWGTEYVLSTTFQQENFAKLMTEAGADLIIGTHPHVIEPVEWIETDNGNRALCYYSLGNFTSTQDEVDRLLGGMASLTIVQDTTGTYIDEESIKAIPLITDYDYPGWYGGTVVTSTYMLRDYTEEMAAAHGITPRKGYTLTREYLITLSQEVFGEYFCFE